MLRFAFLCALVLSLAASAEPFRKITPGRSTKDEVLAKFGEASTLNKSTTGEVLIYMGKQAIRGARQVQFKANADGLIERIDVFPAPLVDPLSIMGTFGFPCRPDAPTEEHCYQKTTTAEGRTLFNYRGTGLAVFFNPDGSSVYNIVYLPDLETARELKVAKPKPPEATSTTPAVVAKTGDAPPAPDPFAQPAGNTAASSSSAAADPFAAPADSTPTMGKTGRPFNEVLGLTTQLRAGVWGASRRLDKVGPLITGMVWAKLSPDLGPNFGLVAEGWFREERTSVGRAWDWRLRDAYLRATVGPVELRVGQQLIIWGRADGINPTDNLSPTDYTLPVSEDSSQRFGVPAAQLIFSLQSFSVSAIWLPYFTSSVIPLPALPPPLTYRSPDPAVQLDQFAARLQQEGGGPLDWSVSYFRGLDLIPDLRVDLADPTSPVLALDHHRIQAFGLDAATTLSGWNLRAEAAYIRTAYDSAAADPFDLIKRPYVSAIGGFDHALTETINLNVQYMFRYVLQHTAQPWIPIPPFDVLGTAFAAEVNQLDEITHGAVVRLAYRSTEGNLEVEAIAAGYVGQGRPLADSLNYLVRGRISYAISDEWKVSLGADWFGGPADTYFGRLKDNSNLFGELRWTF